MDDRMTSGNVSAIDATRIRRRLLAWYYKAARDLPWRRTQQAYKIWVSEIMLQQTQVETVVDYYRRFLRTFPTVKALAAADEDRVLRVWEGLGYYRRARNLHAAARQIVAEHRGQFPRDWDAVRALPGVGKYTAGAVLSMAFDQRRPILEANTIRLFSRLIALRGDPLRSTNQKQLWGVAELLLPEKGSGSGTVNQALMELGSLVCRPKQPDCDRCPLTGDCMARRQSLVDQIPPPARKTSYESRREAAIVVRAGTKILLRQCQADERWAGLWDFPRFHLKSNRRGALLELHRLASAMTRQPVSIGPRLTTMRHGVTKYRIQLECYQAAFQDPPRRLRHPLRWVQLRALSDYPLSVTGRKISQIVLAGGEGRGFG